MGSVRRLLAEYKREQQLQNSTDSEMTDEADGCLGETEGDSIGGWTLRNPLLSTNKNDDNVVFVGAPYMWATCKFAGGLFGGAPCLKSITVLLGVELIVESQQHGINESMLVVVVAGAPTAAPASASVSYDFLKQQGTW